MKLYILTILLFINFSAYSQTVSVVSQNDLQPIENVFITNGKKSVITSINGEANISIFAKTDTLTFNHTSYKTFFIPYKLLQKANFTVKLKESHIRMNEIVVSANRWEQNKKEVPTKILRINPKEIALFSPQTAADLLGASNEVFIQKSQMGGGSPMIRGFAANRILIVVDGVRMNNAIYRSGNLQNVISLDVNNIGGAEVIFGPGSVIYGSDAIGGVMDFHTLRPKFTDNDKVYFSGNAMARYSSANNEKTGHIDFNIGFKKLSFLTSISYSDFDDLTMGSIGNEEYVRPEYVTRIDNKDSIVQNENVNKQVFSGYSQINILQKLRFKPNKKWDINYSFHYSKLSDVPRYDRLIQYSNDKLKYAEWYYGPQNWMMNQLNIKYNKSNILFDKAKLNIAYQTYEESRHDRKLDKTKIRERTENVGALSINLDFDKKLTHRSYLFYGAEVVLNKINSIGQTRDINTGEIEPSSSRYPDDSKYSSYAAYLNYKNNIREKFTLITGMRYSRVIINADFDTTFFKFPFDNININTGALNGSIGLVFRPNNSWQFNINASTGFRAPNIDDVGKVFDSEPGSVVVPNETLGSEYVYNADLGIVKTFEDLLSVDITGFYTILQNAMVRRDFTFNGQDSIMYDGEMSKVQALVNTDEAKVYGVQFGLRADFSKNISFKTNLTYSKGEDKEGLPLRHVAPLFGSTHFIFSPEKLKFNFYVNYNGEISYVNMSPSERDKPHIYAKDDNGNPYSPAWFTLNFKISYQINKFLKINAGVENILDSRYRPYSSGIVASGRNFVFGIKGSI